MKTFYKINCALLAISLLACNKETLVKKNYSKVVLPPFEKVNVPFQSFKIDAEKGGVIDISSGTRITIPVNAFLDKNGNSVEGEVSIQYREFHSAADIIASGIPMAYNSDNQKGSFKSAGMFEINGTQNNEDIFIDKNKSLNVEMASYTGGNDFSFYSLDENGNWKTEGKSDAIENKRKTEALQTVKSRLPVKPKNPLDDKKYFEFDIDYTAYPELKNYDKIKWQVSKENKIEKIANWVFTEKWREVKINALKDKSGLYEIELKSRKKSFTCIAEPLSKNNNKINSADFDKLMVQYEAEKSARELEMKRIENQANWLRVFPVSDFGICNWDSVERMVASGENGFQRFNATFICEKNTQNFKVFHLRNKKDIIQRNDNNEWNKFTYSSLQNNMFLVVLPGDKVGVFNEEQFKKLPKNISKMNINLHALEIKITSAEHLQEVLNSL